MKKVFFPVLVLGLAFAGFFAVQNAEAKIIKKLVIKSIDSDTKIIKAIKSGDLYTINAENAKIRKGSSSSKSMTFSQIEKGDVITVEGTFDDRDVTATKVRDLSYYDKHNVTFYGAIDSLNETTFTLKLDPLERHKQTVSVPKSTKIYNKDNHKINYSGLAENDRVLVTGKWSRKKNTITATKTIDVLHDSEYDDLD